MELASGRSLRRVPRGGATRPADARIEGIGGTARSWPEKVRVVHSAHGKDRLVTRSDEGVA